MLSLQQGLQSSAIITCLYMAFLLWFHKPVLHCLATGHLNQDYDSLRSNKTTLSIDQSFIIFPLNISTHTSTQDSEHKEFTVLLYDVCINKSVRVLYDIHKENVSLVAPAYKL